jgi:hypothetical protein
MAKKVPAKAGKARASALPTKERAAGLPEVTAWPPNSTTVNTPAIVTAAGTALAANAARKAWSLQNLGTNPLYVRLGGTASSTIFHLILRACTTQDDGTGGYLSDDVWQGLVSVAGTSPRFAVAEMT